MRIVVLESANCKLFIAYDAASDHLNGESRAQSRYRDRNDHQEFNEGKTVTFGSPRG